ncbi:hypothetical protein ACVWW5_008385 [Bradyrhizobium sp. LM3.4]
MVNKVCNAAAALTFTVVAVGGFWSLSNSYFICGLALVASIFVRRTVERSFIKRAHRDMVRIHGTDWGCADNTGTFVQAPKSAQKVERVVVARGAHERADWKIVQRDIERLDAICCQDGRVHAPSSSASDVNAGRSSSSGCSID